MNRISSTLVPAGAIAILLTIGLQMEARVLGAQPESVSVADRIIALLAAGRVDDAVTAYDVHVEHNRQFDPDLLGRLVHRVLDEATRTDDSSAAVDACLTLLQLAPHPCRERLDQLADAAIAPPVVRLRAAVAAMEESSRTAERIAMLTDDLHGQAWVAVVDAAPTMPPAVSVPLLSRALTEGTPDVRYGALVRLAEMRSPEALPLLRTWSTRSGTPGHLIALAAVARSGDEAAIDRLKGLLPDLHGPDLLAAGEALAVHGDSKGRDSIRQLLTGPDELLRLEAAAALARLGDTVGFQHLEAELSSADVWVRLRTLEQLHGLGVPVTQRIWRQMADPMAWVRVRAAQVTLEGLNRTGQVAARP